MPDLFCKQEQHRSREAHLVQQAAAGIIMAATAPALLEAPHRFAEAYGRAHERAL